MNEYDSTGVAAKQVAALSIMVKLTTLNGNARQAGFVDYGLAVQMQLLGKEKAKAKGQQVKLTY